MTRWLPIFVLVLVVTSARADGPRNTGEPDSHFGLNELHTFADESEARAACGSDPVVWAERFAGFFYLPDEERYARAPFGAYACKTDAKKARYWGTSVFESLMEYKGKEMKWEYPGY